MMNLLVLGLLDLQQAVRRRVGRPVFTTIAVLLSVVLLAVSGMGYFALWQVERSFQSLTTDSLVGIQAANEMRGRVWQMRLDAARMVLEPDVILSDATIEVFRRDMRRFLELYRAGVFTAADESKAIAIDAAAVKFAAELQARSAAEGDTSRRYFSRVDAAATELATAIDAAYDLNLDGVYRSLWKARDATDISLKTANRIWISFAVYVGCMGLLWLIYRGIALPSEKGE